MKNTFKNTTTTLLNTLICVYFKGGGRVLDVESTKKLKKIRKIDFAHNWVVPNYNLKNRN